MSARLAPLRLSSSGASMALNSLRIWEVTCARRLFHASPSVSRSSKDYKKYLKAKEKARDSLWTPLNGYSSPNKGRYPINVVPNPRKRRRLDSDSILRDLRSGLFDWCRSTKVRQTIVSLGVESDAASSLLQSFEIAARAELTDRDHATTKDRWHLANLESAFDTDYERALHKTYLNRLLDYAVSNNEHSSAQLNPLAQVRKTTDMRFPAEWYPKARSVKRKIIMHVGPTNSGKTYNALRALAAARSGVYAGPLRLLAHEVWERLNNGSISVPPKDAGLDLLDNANPLPARGNPLEEPSRGRACNLLTGEEQRVVDPEAGLVSCTIEMLPSHTFYDVAVIDEIQMLGDPERGLSWTHALLSVCASEVHLCGEATVVDLVRRIAAETGDEFVVNEYQRLTPLVVSPSLDSDLSLVTKGDCVVSFSRSKIFGLKQSIERQTGLKCAVAYGRLPPEVRSEQAQYFNDPESGFDVMVASDAVGMGLNLKIKRVIFSSMSKWNGQEVQALSISQTKQIAGRAGRFGLHSTSTVGEVTTLMADELPQLHNAMDSVNPPVSKAFLQIPLERLQVLYNTLPPGTGIAGLYDVLDQLALPGTNYSPHGFFNLTDAAQFIDREVRGASFEECMKIMNSPTAWREPAIAEVTSVFIQTYLRHISVDLSRILTQNGSMEALRTSQSLEKKDAMKLEATSLDSDDDYSGAVKSEKSKQERYQLLSVLELMHKSLGLYLWFSYRLPLGFSQQSLAFQLKEEVERSIDYLLNTVISAKKRDRLDSEVAHLERSTAPKGFTWEQGAIAKSKAAHSIF